MKSFSAFLPLFLLFVQATDSHAKRILFASQFALIPESEAHRVIGQPSSYFLNPNSIKVMVWNIKKGQEKGLDRDLPAYGKDRDLLLLQEGYLNPLVKGTLQSFSGVRWDMGVAFLYKKDHNYETGTLIGSRVKPTSIKVRQTKDYEPFIKTPKALTIGRYPIFGSFKQLLVISVHGLNWTNLAAFKRHMELARVEIVAHNGPVIFAGDFNTQFSTKLKALKKMTDSLGMQSLEFRNDDRNRVLGRPIDHIFVRGLHPKDAEVLGFLKSSDHKAMMAELALD